MKSYKLINPGGADLHGIYQKIIDRSDVFGTLPSRKFYYEYFELNLRTKYVHFWDFYCVGGSVQVYYNDFSPDKFEIDLNTARNLWKVLVNDFGFRRYNLMSKIYEIELNKFVQFSEIMDHLKFNIDNKPREGTYTTKRIRFWSLKQISNETPDFTINFLVHNELSTNFEHFYYTVTIAYARVLYRKILTLYPDCKRNSY